MVLVLEDRVLETSTTTGTGPFALLGPTQGFQSFNDGVGNNNSTYYAITNVAAGEYEIGIGTYTLSGSTLSRDIVLAGTYGVGTNVPFVAGTKNVFSTLPAGKAVYTGRAVAMALVFA